MNDLLSSPILSPYAEKLREISRIIATAESIHIVSTADLEGVLSLTQIEAGLLDSVRPYKRRILPSKKNVPRDEELDFDKFDGLVILVEPFHEPISTISSENVIHITPLNATVKFSSSDKEHHGAIDCVTICAVIAQLLSPEGVRVRRQRGMMLAGTWLRQNLDTNYAPIMSALRDHLDEEGSIDIRPLPEVKNPIVSMIPGLSERFLLRISKNWDSLNIDERSSALSDLVLPTLTHSGLSTMRLEELIWHRVLLPGCDIDLASQLYSAKENWPDDSNSSRIHASNVADNLIINGYL